MYLCKQVYTYNKVEILKLRIRDTKQKSMLILFKSLIKLTVKNIRQIFTFIFNPIFKFHK